MSALTKVFVVLLVIGSLLLTASLVVFVSKQDNLYQANQNLQEEANRQRTAAQAATNQLAAQRQAYEEAVAQLERQRSAAAGVEQNLQREIANRDGELARLRSQIVSHLANVTSLTEAVNTGQSTLAHLNQQLEAEFQQTNLLRREGTELSAAVSDLTNRLEVTERERRNLQEQLVETTRQADRFSGLLRDAGIDPREVRPDYGIGPGAPPIAGHVRNVQVIAGIEYATISVGAADGVRPQMEFQIIDTQGGRYLGVLRIDRVDANESIGRIERADDLAQIRPGHEVRTQL